MTYRVNVRKNWKKVTRNFVLNSNTDGDSGRKSFAGHWHVWRDQTGRKVGSLSLHFVPRNETDRPCVLLVDPADVYAIRKLCDDFLAEMNTME